MGLEENYYAVVEGIRQAALRAQREVASVKLVAVSKKQDPEKLRILWNCGQRIFGENRIQEARAKIPEMPSGGEWHFIGEIGRAHV